jgi:hypothetical protein
METHVKAVAVLNIILGAMGVVAAAAVALLFSGMVQEAGLEGIVVAILLATSAPVLIGGIALWRRAPWSRVYMIVVSAIELVNVPFGTALGIYSIWTLTRSETPRLFARPPQ